MIAKATPREIIAFPAKTARAIAQTLRAAIVRGADDGAVAAIEAAFGQAIASLSGPADPKAEPEIAEVLEWIERGRLGVPEAASAVDPTIFACARKGKDALRVKAEAETAKRFPNALRIFSEARRIKIETPDRVLPAIGTERLRRFVAANLMIDEFDDATLSEENVRSLLRWIVKRHPGAVMAIPRETADWDVALGAVLAKCGDEIAGSVRPKRKPLLDAVAPAIAETIPTATDNRAVLTWCRAARDLNKTDRTPFGVCVREALIEDVLKEFDVREGPLPGGFSPRSGGDERTRARGVFPHSARLLDAAGAIREGKGETVPQITLKTMMIDGLAQSDIDDVGETLSRTLVLWAVERHPAAILSVHAGSSWEKTLGLILRERGEDLPGSGNLAEIYEAVRMHTKCDGVLIEGGDPKIVRSWMAKAAREIRNGVEPAPTAHFLVLNEIAGDGAMGNGGVPIAARRKENEPAAPAAQVPAIAAPREGEIIERDAALRSVMELPAIMQDGVVSWSLTTPDGEEIRIRIETIRK
jgi:hypothetical protein